MIPRVTKLTEEGQFDAVADELPPPPVDEQPMDNVVVGFESKFEEVWQSVQSNDCPVIGLVGMGGVGKTTLMKQLNNKFLKATHEYDLVIWIVVSKPAHLGRIQGALRSKLNIPNSKWVDKSDDQRASLIFSELKKKKFVVLLDDMWETLELSEVGIPRPSKDNKSKIVFTTRSRNVCHSMDACKVIHVGCLQSNEAFSLFYSKLGEDILKSHPEMRGLITDVANECEGLPLALITIGRAMRGKTDPRQWKEAKRTLEKYPSTFPGMEGGVFSKLVFSYDSLPNPMVKKCFEYCSLFPEDHHIFKEEVIELWLAEGYISGYDSMIDALIQGRQIMESLKQSCLLETGKSSLRYDREEETVKMHDVIRDMALWIACKRGKKRNKFYIESVAPNAITNAEKMSLWGRDITSKSLAGMSFCPNLATLIMQDTGLEELPGEIPHSLKVLHLSYNHYLKSLTPSGMGSLENLEYLNVAWTQIRLLPYVYNWKKLKFLIVDDKVIIPAGIISDLLSLQMFEQSNVRTIDPITHIESERLIMETELLSELEGLKHIMDVRPSLYTAAGIKELLDSPKLQSCSTRLVLRQLKTLRGTLDLGTETLTKHLESLQVYWCEVSAIILGRPSLINNLCEVTLYCCLEIRDLSSLIYVPNLRILSVCKCASMEELIGERSANVEGTSLFSWLTSLTFELLPKLRSICPQLALPFPSLKSMEVGGCMNLLKLPFDSNTASTTPPEFRIRGRREWWEGLKWDSQATKDAFSPKFIDYGGGRRRDVKGMPLPRKSYIKL